MYYALEIRLGRCGRKKGPCPRSRYIPREERFDLRKVVLREGIVTKKREAWYGTGAVSENACATIICRHPPRHMIVLRGCWPQRRHRAMQPQQAAQAHQRGGGK